MNFLKIMVFWMILKIKEGQAAIGINLRHIKTMTINFTLSTILLIKTVVRGEHTKLAILLNLSTSLSIFMEDSSLLW